MSHKTRSGLAWSISILGHVLLLFLALPLGGKSAGGGMEILEVGLVEMSEPTLPTHIENQSPVAAAAEQPRSAPAIEPTRVDPGTDAPAVTTSEGVTGSEPVIAPDIKVPGRDGTTPGAEEQQDFGTGEGFIVTSPVYYPKEAQNEGVEGTVKLAVRLSTAGEAEAEIIASSGDDLLDRYSVWAIENKWLFKTPPVPLIIEINMVFAADRVGVIFAGTRPWPEEGSGT